MVLFVEIRERGILISSCCPVHMPARLGRLPVPTESDLELANKVAPRDLAFLLNSLIFVDFGNVAIFGK